MFICLTLSKSKKPTRLKVTLPIAQIVHVIDSESGVCTVFCADGTTYFINESAEIVYKMIYNSGYNLLKSPRMESLLKQLIIFLSRHNSPPIVFDSSKFKYKDGQLIPLN